MKYGLNVKIVRQVNSGDTRPRTYVNVVLRALKIDGWYKDTEVSTPRPPTTVPAPAPNQSQGSSQKRGKFSLESRGGSQLGFGQKSPQGNANRFWRRSNNRSQSNFGNRSQSGNDNTRGWKDNKQRQSDKNLQNMKAWTITSDSAGRFKRCGGVHEGTCYASSLVCYWCGQEGHLYRVCLNPKEKPSAPKEQPMANARVFTIYKDEVRGGTYTIVASQISVDTFSAYALIDFGAMHSFIASSKSINHVRVKRTFWIHFLWLHRPVTDTILLIGIRTCLS